MKRLTKAGLAQLCAALLLGSIAASAYADDPALGQKRDDTEVYTTTPPGYDAAPIVMLYIELASNLGATSGVGCSGLNTDGSNLTTACPQFRPLAPYFVYPSAATNYASIGAPQGTNNGLPVTLSDFGDGALSEFEVLRAALKRVIIAQEKEMKVGVIAVHAYDNNCVGPQNNGHRCSNGAYILKAATMMEPATAILNANGISGAFDALNQTHINTVISHDATRLSLFAKLNALPAPNSNLWHANKQKEVYFELFRYLTGEPVFNGLNGWNDYSTNNDNTNIGNTNDIFTYHQGVTAGGGTSPFDGTFNTGLIGLSGSALYYNGTVLTYNSPIDRHCQKIFMINMNDSIGISDSDSDPNIRLPFSQYGMNMAVDNNMSTGLTQMAHVLYDLDLANGNDPDINKRINPNLSFADTQNVTSFFLASASHVTDFNDPAREGGSGRPIPIYYDDPTNLVSALNRVFNQILSVSTTYTAASIPVNVFNRSQTTDSAYFALFQTDQGARPAWYGDLKRLKLTLDSSNNIYLIDANGQPAIAPDGRIDSGALTFWTNPSGYDILDTTDVTGNDPDPVANADGRAVTRGGAGQKIPGFLNGTSRGTPSWTNAATGARKIYTELKSGATATSQGLMDLQWSNISYLWNSIIDSTDTAAYNTMALWPAASSLTSGSAFTPPYQGGWTYDKTYYQSLPCYSYGTTSITATAPTSTLQSTCKINDLASNVVAYIRGYDVNATGGSNATQTNALRLNTRRWLMGDPLHSRPLPINYGARPGYSTSNPDVRIIAGNNDGFLRMIQNSDTTGSPSGKENWAFMPLETLKIQKQLMDNIPADNITLPLHPYGVDGTPVAYVRDNGNGTINPSDSWTDPVTHTTFNDVVWVFSGLRRGGRAFYGMDITNPDDPPKFKWKVSNYTATNYGSVSGESATAQPEMGYSFATPYVRHMDWGQGKKPVLIFSGGYDLNKDIVGLGTDDSMGRAVYIVNADTGAIVWAVKYGTSDTAYNSTTHMITRAAMVDSIPSSVSPIDSDGDGLIDRLYVGDTGGRVWRIDTPAPATPGTDPRSNWEADVLLNLGRHSVTTTPTYADDRRFFYGPDVVPTKDTNGNYDAVVIGSGNREHPLGTLNTDYVYMYKDRCTQGTLSACKASSVAPSSPVTPSQLFDATSDCLQATTNGCTLDDANAGGLNLGWRMQLTTSGEKVLSGITTLKGNLYFTTYVPASTLLLNGNTVSCTPEGDGFQYVISLDSAQAVFNFSSYGEGILNVYDRKRELASKGIASDDVYVSICQGSNCYSGELAPDGQANPNVGTQQWQTFWYEQNR